jgi:hypothetical protein
MAGVFLRERRKAKKGRKKDGDVKVGVAIAIRYLQAKEHQEFLSIK